MSKKFAIFGAGLSAQAARRLAEAKGLSVVLIDEGKAIATGTHQHLLETVPRYSEILSQQNRLLEGGSKS